MKQLFYIMKAITIMITFYREKQPEIGILISVKVSILIFISNSIKIFLHIEKTNRTELNAMR